METHSEPILTERDERGGYIVPLPGVRLGGKRAVVLYSGGMDSTVALALACWSYEEVHALAITYGQRHINEVWNAEQVCKNAGIKFHRVMADPSIWKQVPLCDPNGQLPEGRPVYAIRDGGIPTSFVPGRNGVFLSFAIALAGTLGGAHILIGATKEDQGGYPDCRPLYFAAMNVVAAHAMPDREIAVYAPLVGMTKRQVAELGRRMAVDFDRTWSCYRPRGAVTGVEPCGTCDACVLRADALAT